MTACTFDGGEPLITGLVENRRKHKLNQWGFLNLIILQFFL